MSRKSKYSAEQKLSILNELTRSSISEVAKKYAVGKKTIRIWGYLYKYQGIDGIRATNNNQNITLVTNKFMGDIKSIVKVAMIRNHFVIVEAKPSHKKSGQKLLS